MASKNIAIVGTAVVIRDAAPFDKDDWLIWATACVNDSLPRCDMWHEIHSKAVCYDPVKSPGHKEWMASKNEPIVINEPMDVVKNPIILQRAKLVEKFGDGHFTSSIAIMLAMAIMEMPKAIGVWGVDASSESEYKDQFHGIKHFLTVAQYHCGIDVFIPAGSDLLRHPPFYPDDDQSMLAKKIATKIAQLEPQKVEAERIIEAQKERHAYMRGALDMLKLAKDNWDI